MFSSLTNFDDRNGAKRQLRSTLAGVLGELSLDFDGPESSILPPPATNQTPNSTFLSQLQQQNREKETSNMLHIPSSYFPTPSFEDSIKPNAMGIDALKLKAASSRIPPLTATSLLLQGFEASRFTSPKMEAGVNNHHVVADSYRASLLKNILEQEKSRLVQESYLKMLRQEQQNQQQQQQQQDLFQVLKNDVMHKSLRSRLAAGSSSHSSWVLPQAQGLSVHSSFNIMSSPPLRSTAIPSTHQPASARRVADAIGSTLRAGQPYIDVTALPGLDDTGVVAPRNRGGVMESFPEKLHRMLKEAEDENLTNIVSFLPHGRAFCVHDVEAFVSKILPKYFKQSKWNSFARQLNLYGFNRITSGPDAGAYYHELFLKGRTTLCLHMRRVGVPQQDCDRRKCKPKQSTSDYAPDFYSMKPLR